MLCKDAFWCWCDVGRETTEPVKLLFHHRKFVLALNHTYTVSVVLELYASTATVRHDITCIYIHVETGDDELRFASSAGSTKTKLSSQSALSCVCGNLWRMVVFVLYIMDWTVALGRMKWRQKWTIFLCLLCSLWFEVSRLWTVSYLLLEIGRSVSVGFIRLYKKVYKKCIKIEKWLTFQNRLFENHWYALF